MDTVSADGGPFFRSQGELKAHCDLGLRWRTSVFRQVSCLRETVMHYVWRLVDDVTRYAGQLDRQQWIVLSFLVLVLGLITMRGFGSRNNY